MESHLSLCNHVCGGKKKGQVLQNHQIPLPYEDWDTVLWLTTSPNTFLDGSTLMNYAR